MARPVKSTDLLGITFVSDPQLSPDASRVAVVMTTVVTDDGAAEPSDSNAAAAKPPRYRSRVELYDAKGGRLELTRGQYGDTAARFSPGGDRVAFLRTGGEKERPQLHVIPVGGGEAVKLTEHGAGVSEFAWHLDGERLVYLSRGEWKDELAPDSLPRRIVERRYRADGLVGFVPTQDPGLYVADAASGESHLLAELGATGGGLRVSPDGSTAYLVLRDRDSAAHAAGGDLAAVDLSTGAVTTLLSDVVGLGSVVPSPDGTTLAYVAAADQADFVSGPSLWTVGVGRSRAGAPEVGEPKLLSGGLEVQSSAGGDTHLGAYPQDPTWLADGSLLCLVNEEGATFLASIRPDGAVTRVQEPGRRVLSAFAASPGGDANGTVAFLAETPSEPPELWLRANGAERRLSRANDAWLRDLELVEPAGPFAAGDAGAPYWLMEPTAPRPDRAAVVQVHGGPHTNYGYGFYFEFQLLASKGYAVIYGNPRGSSSYGFAFKTAMLGEYGSVDADDVMAFVDAGLTRSGRQEAPVHLTGGSYGGFMTNWLVGQTDRFRSAVTQRSICNWTSMYGTSDIGPWFVDRQLAGVPWGDAEALWRQSPIRFADRVVTPLLIVHSEEDYRCPVEQGEQLFAVLKQLGKAETEFLRIPGESHGLSRAGRPDRRIARLDAILEWFERHA